MDAADGWGSWKQTVRERTEDKQQRHMTGRTIIGKAVIVYELRLQDLVQDVARLFGATTGWNNNK